MILIVLKVVKVNLVDLALNIESIGAIVGFVVGAMIGVVIDDQLNLVEDIGREVGNVVGDDESANSTEGIVSFRMVRGIRDTGPGRMELT